MVSLINFKIVNEELHQHGGECDERAPARARQDAADQQVWVPVAQHRQHQQHQHQHQHQHQQHQHQHQHQHQQQRDKDQAGQRQGAQEQRQPPARHQKCGVSLFGPVASPFVEPIQADKPRSCFTVTWRNLKFAIEPKWHERLAGDTPLARLASRLAPAGGTRPGAPVTRVVLDQLDGSFRSGELTAILGPSGAGKTTLLDCLTGHRKHGLSGSIRISSGSAARCLQLAQPHGQSGQRHHHGPGRAHPHPHRPLHQPLRHNHNYNTNLTPAGLASHGDADCCCPAVPGRAPVAPTNADNLKVSIIPQNDHLMGHLTVYETLNYASKMKNCFDKQFNHKLNIRRVAQQLGLMSCLATRINKLSGGQYKRVSIAQELLSSPDILILDEPTSGLDAMTCYQTVQVLKQLTDDESGGQKQIAVILTIHQPNGDVFQQFNNVYVVAQGGKCIYEGPPSGIESVINRVGIQLPNSYYNPATMIVEVAAGKFGQEAIHKLNGIQKKQYEFVAPIDEQNSTGDSAVDCPSSNDDDNDYEDDDDNHNDENPGDQLGEPIECIVIKGADGAGQICCMPLRLTTEINNNSTLGLEPVSGGLVNEGFVAEQGDAKGVEDVVVVVAAAGGNCASGQHQSASAFDTAKLHGTGDDESSGQDESRRKKRRRTRRRANEQGATNGANGGAIGAPGAPGAPGREKRLKLNSLKADQGFPFWRHTYLHFHRSWLSIVRDPMLCSMQLALHIIVPLMVSLVYGTNVGKPNACPRAGPVDIMAYALEPTDTALQLQEDLRTTLENIGYIFFKLYGIIFAAMTVTVLTFPLDMHVLVKEFRNGWYGLSSYFLGRTLADIPFQLTLPLLAMSLSYYATGQPYSYMQWRFLSITAILILSSLIAQSQGLLFGAILMDKMKAAVFVAPAATTPIILFAGFLVRTQSIPRYLRPLSNLSYLRYAIEACLISRYGFNQCECDPAIFNQTVPELPPIARSMLDYWLSSFKPALTEAHDSTFGATTSVTNSNINASSLIVSLETTTAANEPASQPTDLFTKLIDSLAKANSFGRNITSCEQVVPYPMIDYDLKDSQLFNCFAILLLMLIFTRLLTFFIVCFKVKRKV